jgi:hypothetical protein
MYTQVAEGQEGSEEQRDESTDEDGGDAMDTPVH